MSSSGFRLIAGKVPTERVSTATSTSNSSGFTTTETSILTVSAPLVVGRVYRVTFFGLFASSDSSAEILVRIREDSLSGAQVQSAFYEVWHTSATGVPAYAEVEHTAVSTASKTFAATCVRSGGLGTINLAASSSNPTYLFVDYIRG